ncbi:MAG: hypothetical protein NVSMB27_30580 [Ktedonobacteraceae bacterium]
MVQEPRWWLITKRLLLPVGIITVVSAGVIVLILFVYRLNLPWTGFTQRPIPNTSQYQPAKTLWDWMQLLIVPLFLSASVISISHILGRSSRERDDDRRREDELQKYKDNIEELILKEHLRESQAGAEVRDIAQARTLAVLQRFDAPRRESVIKFLYGAGLIKNEGGNAILDLKGADLSRIDLRRTDLSKIDLHGTNLSYADLRMADLSGANLSEAFLYRTKLREAILNRAILNRATLIKAALSYARLSGANLSNAKLSKADLRWAYLGEDHDGTRTNLENADLSNADLSGGWWLWLIGADFHRAYMRKAKLRGANLRRTILEEADLHQAELDWTDLRRTNLKGASLLDAHLQGANLSWLDLSNTGLSEADLRKANLRGTDLKRAILDSADLQGAKLRWANLDDAFSLKGTNLRGVKGLTKEKLEACKTKGAIVEEDATTGSS